MGLVCIIAHHFDCHMLVTAWQSVPYGLYMQDQIPGVQPQG